jgi:DNA polymerase
VTDADRDELRRLVRRARMLVAAEREGGVVDLPGTPAPPEAAAAPAPPAPAMPPPATPAVAAPRARAVPAPAPQEADFAPRVRTPDLPADVLAPFGDLPTEVAACERCALCRTRTRTVFGEGRPSSRLVFCGEAPGFEEDRSGRPFVGRAGELLTDMIEKGLKVRREDVFILNAIKCRPPENRTPAPDEIAACRPFLERQLATIAPRIIVALGNPACRALLGNVPGIMTIRGKVFEGFGARIVPTFHPAYVLRNPDAKRDVWNDLKLVMRLLAEPA